MYKRQRIRSFGAGTKPVFLSEYGIGSLFHVIDEWRQFEQHHTRADLEDASWLAYQANSLLRDWARFGLESVYPFPEQMLNDSYRLSARYRTIGFNPVSYTHLDVYKRQAQSWQWTAYTGRRPGAH